MFFDRSELVAFIAEKLELKDVIEIEEFLIREEQYHYNCGFFEGVEYAKTTKTSST